jgi:ribosomal protein L29
MKRNDIKALHGLSIAELQKKLIESVAVLARIKLEKKVGKLSNVKTVSSTSDDIARIKTVLREKEMEA